MKKTHRDDVRCWSRFDEARNMDFNSLAWLRDGGAILVDPLPLCEHDRRELEAAGPVTHVVVTNSDHLRDAPAIAAAFEARVIAPAAEREALAAGLDGLDVRWVEDGQHVVDGLAVLALDGSKTPGELALLLELETLVTGDLVRAPVGGQLTILPDAKLRDRAAAVESVQRLAALPNVDAVLVGDGWPIFSHGRAALTALARRLA